MRIMRTAIACQLALLAALAGVVAQPATADLYPPLQPLWTFGAEQGFYAAPTVVGNRLYATSRDGNVYALDAATGEVVWTHTTGDMVYSGVVVADGTAYVASSDKQLYALNLADGTVRWQRELDGLAYASPVVAGGVVVAGTGETGTLAAFDARTGQPRWTVTMEGRLGSGLAAAGNRVYAPSYDGHVYAIDAATGDVRWRFDAGGVVDSIPLVEGDTVYVKLPHDQVIALNAATGAARWRYDPKTLAPTDQPTNWSPLIMTDDRLLFGSQDGRLYALEAAGGERAWASAEGTERPAPPTPAGELGWVGGRDGSLSAIDLGTGEAVWTWHPPAAVEPELLSGIMWPPVVVGDRLYAASLDGNLYAFRGATDGGDWRLQRQLAERVREALGEAMGPNETIGTAEVQSLVNLGERVKGFLVWESNRSGAWELYRINTDGSGFQRLTRFSEGQNPLAWDGYLRPRVAPDGRQVLFNYGRRGGRSEAWLVPADGGEAKKITEGNALNWTADGRSFYLIRDGRVLRHDLADGNETPVGAATLPIDGKQPDVGAVRPDTSMVALRGPRRNEVFNTQTGESVRTMGGCEPQFSADGRYLYWVEGPKNFHVVDLETGEERQLLGQPPVEPFNYTYFPTVTRDGRWLAYGASPNQHDHNTSNYEIYLQELRDWRPVGAPVRFSWHPRTDRWPTLWVGDLDR